MEWLILFVLVVGILAFLSKGKGAVAEEFPYRLENALFTPAERSFYGVLCQAAADKGVVFGKVRVADVLKPAKGLGRSNWQKAFNKISAKHFDFALCRPDDLSVLAVIELDDKSHNQKKRIARGELLEGACQASGLTLHRFKASSSYSIHEVRGKLFPPPVVAGKRGQHPLR